MRARGQDASLFRRFVRPVLVGVGVGVLVCFVLLLGLALVIQNVDVPLRAATPLAIGAAAAGALAAGWTAAAIAREKGIWLGLGCGIVLFLLILAAGLIRAGGVSGGTTLIKLAVLTAAGGLGGIVGVNRRHR